MSESNVESSDSGDSGDSGDYTGEYDMGAPAEIVDSGAAPSAQPVGIVATAQALFPVAKAFETMDPDQISAAIEAFKKSQVLKLVDFTLFGPIMVWYAYKGKLGKFERGILGLIGVSTLYYNYKHWKENQSVLGAALEKVAAQIKSSTKT